MKKLKKLLSIVLAVAMIFTLTATALADDSSEDTTTTTTTGYTITINGDKTGHVYEAYQIFSGDLSGDETSGYVLSNIEWGNGVDSSKFLTALKASTVVVGADSDGNNITLGSLFSSCTTAAEVAEVLAGYNDNSAVAQAFAQLAYEHKSDTATGTSSADSTDGTKYTISDLSAGYYLVIDRDNSVTAEGDAYTDVILEVVSNVKVNVKAEYPTVDKDVSEDGTTWADYTDADIGDTVYYKLTATVPDTSAYSTYAFTFHDILSTGLTFDSTKPNMVVTVYAGSDDTTGTKIPATYTDSDGNTTTNWTLVASNLTGGCTFEVVFTDILSLVDESGNAVKIDEDYTIVVTYEATLNENAVIGNDGNTNSVYLEYSNNPDGSGTGKTTTVTVVTFTFELDVTKVDGDDNDTKLEGAEFVLYYTETSTDSDGNETTTTYYLTADENEDADSNTIGGNYTVTGWTTTKADATTLVSASDGTFEIIGLDVRTYYLKETKAPTGYNLLDSAITIVISATYEDTDNDGVSEVKSLTATADGKSLTTNVSNGTIAATIENNSGSTLPSTGGIGTTIFYVVGGVLILGAVVLLITRKRMNNEEK